MGFFDFNIPYLEGGTDKTLRKNTRLKLVVKAMELGYSGIAYNRTIKGVMSDSDCCSISLLPLSSLLKHAPSLSSSVAFHRRLLNVPTSSPFRQYTRLTVACDSTLQAAALNSGNPILKTYDLVAVRPLNQIAFEQACKVAEVDIIAIDFSEKLPFRLKLPMVQAAMKRGIYFEITYSGLVADIQARRQIITNAKLLINWTRGKNLIFSSAATSVNELRGPYDVANMSCLLGLSSERAKAATSKNCRSLIASSLRKKQFYKEAIRVELIPPEENVDSYGIWFSEQTKWDPISSGEGDLHLEDLARSLSAINKVTKTAKAIDFASVIGDMPSHGFRVKDLMSKTQVVSQKLEDVVNVSSSLEVRELAVATKVASEQSRHNLRSEDHILELDSSFEQQISGGDSSQKSDPQSNVLDVLTKEEPEKKNGSDVKSCENEIENVDLQQQNCITNFGATAALLDENKMEFRCSAASNGFAVVGALPAPNEVTFLRYRKEEFNWPNRTDTYSDMEHVENNKVSSQVIATNEVGLCLPKGNATFNEESNRLHNTDGGPDTEIVGMGELFSQGDTIINEAYLDENLLEIEPLGKFRDNDAVLGADEMPVVESCGKSKGSDESSVATTDLIEEVIMEVPKRGDDKEIITLPFDEFISGEGLQKQSKRNSPILFPFKRFVNPIFFKRKAKRAKKKVKLE